MSKSQKAFEEFNERIKHIVKETKKEFEEPQRSKRVYLNAEELKQIHFNLTFLYTMVFSKSTDDNPYEVEQRLRLEKIMDRVEDEYNYLTRPITRRAPNRSKT